MELEHTVPPQSMTVKSCFVLCIVARKHGNHKILNSIFLEIKYEMGVGHKWSHVFLKKRTSNTYEGIY